MAYNSIFYQIYPIGFCNAPTHNDGQCVPRIRCLASWADYLRDLGVDAVLLNPVFESDNHGMTPGTSGRSTAVWALMTISPTFARLSMSTVSRSCWMVFSITWEEASGPSGMCRRRNGTPLIRTGSASISTGTAATTTASGTRLGGPLRAGEAESSQPGSGGLPA